MLPNKHVDRGKGGRTPFVWWGDELLFDNYLVIYIEMIIALFTI